MTQTSVSVEMALILSVYVPKIVLLNRFASDIHYAWDKLLKHMRFDPEVQSYPNFGGNETERDLPYKVSLELTYLTPYFEILFVLELVFLYHDGVCYMSMDNILCILNLHVAGQFRILQHKLENLQSESKEKFIENWKPYSARSEDECYAMFRSCVLQHQELIAYCGKLEKLFMFTYSCDCLMHDSRNVAMAMYGAPWNHLSMNKNGRALRKDLKLVILRSRKSCCVTAHGFFPVSLETFTKIVSTAMSYFTLIQGQAVNAT
ncbi:odorant receptor 30a-like [Hylaeus anthracinus]|uniref:odorant receptor 30a-like n=1 Tax=Hylaeus anthracinus TaxID=313031 RepID=UPI0023B927BB|nr:odorant receptor 30a-like [Hylaeus anthracinus]